MSNTSPLELVYMLVVLVLVIVLAYFVSKWLSKRGSVQMQGNIRHFKVIDKLVLGQDKAVYIVQVGGKSLLLGVTQHHIENLGEVTISELESFEKPSGTSFSDALKATLKNNWGIGSGKQKTEVKNSPDGEEKQNLDDV